MRPPRAAPFRASRRHVGKAHSPEPGLLPIIADAAGSSAARRRLAVRRPDGSLPKGGMPPGQLESKDESKTRRSGGSRLVRWAALFHFCLAAAEAINLARHCFGLSMCSAKSRSPARPTRLSSTEYCGLLLVLAPWLRCPDVYNLFSIHPYAR